MSKECCCGRRFFRCAESQEISRREFLREVGAAAVAITAADEVLGAEAPAERRDVAMPKATAGKYPITPPRSFTGRNLEAVAMPIGGIGTGTVWLDGRGRLSVWQIFNNYTEEGLPGSFFAVRAQTEGAEPVMRVLQTVPEEGFGAFKSLVFRAGYPIADVEFEDEGFPIRVKMEAFNPMIPLDTRNSAIPCAVFRFTVRNTSS
ncbi:MAG: GH116 family glycosyl-hydrolase, partial [Armatimonadota bacterium]